MRLTTGNLSILILVCMMAAGILVSGCGEKIAIPQPVGVYSNTPYEFSQTFDDADLPVQLTQYQGFLYVVGPSALVKRNQAYDEQFRVDGLSEASAVCVEPDSGFVFVWEEGAGRVSWYDSSDLTFLGSTALDGVGRVVAMESNPAGIDLVPGALTFLYLSDPETGLIHRYSFDSFNGLSSYGILANDVGDGVRSVHVAAGMATDLEGMLLVCDADTNRNWVIRFDSEPDMTDTTPDPSDEDPLRGLVTTFGAPTCTPDPAPEDYVLGYAASCGQLDWVGRPGSIEGEFYFPYGVGVDASGQILVADTANNRIQIFDRAGEITLSFPTDGSLPRPVSVAPVAKRTANDVYPSALVYILLADLNQVALYQQSAYKNDPSRGE